MRRAALGGISRWWVRPSRAARQAGQRGTWRRPYLLVLRSQHPAPAHRTPRLGSPSGGGEGRSAGAGVVGLDGQFAVDQPQDPRGARLLAAGAVEAAEGGFGDTELY